MRYFKVYFDKNVVGDEPEECVLEFEDNTPMDEIAEGCAEVLQTMIDNSTYSGWEEVEEPS